MDQTQAMWYTQGVSSRANIDIKYFFPNPKSPQTKRFVSIIKISQKPKVKVTGDTIESFEDNFKKIMSQMITDLGPHVKRLEIKCDFNVALWGLIYSIINRSHTFRLLARKPELTAA